MSRPADQSAPLPISARRLSGGATLPTLRGAERKVAEPGARRAVTAFSFAAAVWHGACRAGSVGGAGGGGGGVGGFFGGGGGGGGGGGAAPPPPPDLQPGITSSNEPSRLLAGQRCGAMARELAIVAVLVRHGAALRLAGARRRCWRARRRRRADPAPRVTARGLAGEPRRGVRAARRVLCRPGRRRTRRAARAGAVSARSCGRVCRAARRGTSARRADLPAAVPRFAGGVVAACRSWS